MVNLDFLETDGLTDERPCYNGQKVIVLSQGQAKEYEPSDKNEICMSIIANASVGMGHGSEVELSRNFKDILRLKFNDNPDKSLGWDINPDNVDIMTQEDAIKIKQFLIDNSDFSTLIIHCFAGISRSRSVAAAIVEYLDLPYIYTVQNSHVYNLVKNELNDTK